MKGNMRVIHSLGLRHTLELSSRLACLRTWLGPEVTPVGTWSDAVRLLVGFLALREVKRRFEDLLGGIRRVFKFKSP